MPLTNYASEQLLKYGLTNAAVDTRPTGWTVRLHTADPGQTGASEVSGSGYAAQATTFAFGTTDVANTAAVTFPTVTGSGYTVTHVSVWDTAGTPKCWYTGALAVAKVCAVGEALAFPIGELRLDLV